ncbi:hypothetical protein, partial [Acinetobacter baumannii]|uniref:hypothetical protein n=1 Tax=Acinetobacter baumannii TaxID=470 RepID=UPI0033924291
GFLIVLGDIPNEVSKSFVKGYITLSSFELTKGFPYYFGCIVLGSAEVFYCDVYMPPLVLMFFFSNNYRAALKELS